MQVLGAGLDSTDAPRPILKSKDRWREELVNTCRKAQKKRLQAAECRPQDVESRLNLTEERKLYTQQELQALRLRNTEWLDIVKKLYTDWYYPPDLRDQLVSIFVKYDPDGDMKSWLENFRYVMTIAGEGEDADEESRDDDRGQFEGKRVSYSGKAVGCKLLEQRPQLIVGANSSELTQTMLRFAVTKKLEWPLQLVSKFYEDQCVPNKHRHKEFMRDLSSALQEEVQEKSVLDIAVASGNLQVMEELVNLLRLCKIDQSLRAKPLHRAITAGLWQIAQRLVNAFPKMIEEIVEDKSVLETLELSSILSDKTEKNDLEEYLVRRIYHIEGRPLHVKRLLHGPLGNNKEYHLDLSCFNDPNYDFDKFLNRTEQPSAGQPDMFTSIVLPQLLLYVGLPKIRGTDWQSRQKKLDRIIDWLLRRNVKEILKLRMPDLEHDPYREDDVERCLSKFDEIEELNWEKLDLSLEVLGNGEGKIRGVRKIWLYSANWGMISYWTGVEGVFCHRQSLIGFNKAQLYKDSAIERLKERRKEAKDERRDLAYSVKIIEWDSPSGIDTSTRQSKELQSLPSLILGLEPFLRSYRGLLLAAKSTSDPPVDFSTKVAILDTGVDISQPGLRASIQSGYSFVEHVEQYSESPWWLASDPHGTQMASIIQNIDPKAKIFIGKVGISRKHVILPEKVLEGVKWALAQGVDIISISMTFYEPHPGLQWLLQTASNLGVTVMCSTADAGQQGPRVYPAAWIDRTISISVCNRHFTASDLTDLRATYFLPGENVFATALSYAEADDTVSGSSVATAMASGLSSLILSCRNYSRLADGKARTTDKQRKQLIIQVLNLMLREQTGKSVMPERFFNEDQAKIAVRQDNPQAEDGEQPQRADDTTWRKWIQMYFGQLIVSTAAE